MKKQIKIKCVFTSDVLGSRPDNPKLTEEFIASKAPNQEATDEEMRAAPAGAEPGPAGRTVFPCDAEGRIHLWDYQLKGFLKEALRFLAHLGETPISAFGAGKAVDMFVFVGPRKIYLQTEAGGPVTKPDGNLQRPLRAENMGVERVALADSDVIRAGAGFECDIAWHEGGNTKSKLARFSRETISAMLDYGAEKGLGQWRNAGYGRFAWEAVEVK